MKNTFLCLAFFLVSTSLLAADTPSPSHLAAVKELFKQMELEKTIVNGIDQMVEMQVHANPQLAQYRPTMKAFFKKYMSWETLAPDFEKIYMKEFTEPEIKEITHFYTTPIGKKLLKKQPELFAQGAALGQGRVQAHLPELTEMLKKAQPAGSGDGAGRTKKD